MRKAKSNELTEHQIQSAYFDILKLNEQYFPELKYIFAIPNGGKRTIGVAVKMKKEGVKKGVPDIFIPLTEKNNYMPSSGLWIETKTEIGKQSPEQKDFMNFLMTQNYKYALCRNTESMVRITELYLNINFEIK
jgi:hypothetical protein